LNAPVNIFDEAAFQKVVEEQGAGSEKNLGAKADMIVKVKEPQAAERARADGVTVPPALEQQLRGAMRGLGLASHQIAQLVPGEIHQMLEAQAAMLAYKDLFLYCGVAAFCVVPFAFLLSPTKAGGGGGAGGH
ncbi:MAG: hypothetical protein B7Z80_22580, partial [Rhodospirillales bacterium 20-64-7]